MNNYSEGEKMRLEIVLGQEEDGTYSVHCPYFEVTNEK